MSTEETIAATELPVTVEPTADDAPATENAPAAAETKESKPKKAKKSFMERVDDDMFVYTIMSRLDCTTKELIRTTATISQRWRNLWTLNPHLIFEGKADIKDSVTDLNGYISSIDDTLTRRPKNSLKKFKLDIKYSCSVNSEFKLKANNWICYAIDCNVEEVDLRLYNIGMERHSYDGEFFFNNSCFIRVKLSECRFVPPNGAISWKRLECLCLSFASLNEVMIKKILSGSPCLESLELNECYGYRLIDVTSTSVKKLVFCGYCFDSTKDWDFADSIEINAPYISSLTIKGYLDLKKLVLLDVSSLVEVNLDYLITWTENEKVEEEVFKGLLESLGHVKHITFGRHCSKLLSRLKAGSDMVADDLDENGD